MSSHLYPWPLPPAPSSKAAHSWYDALVRDVTPTLQVRKLHPDAIVPAQSYSGGGWLLHASPIFKSDEFPLRVQARMAVPTGLQIVVPPGYMALTLPLHDMRTQQRIDVHTEAFLPDGPVDVYVRVANKGKTKRLILPNACIGRLVLVKLDHRISLQVVDHEDASP